MTHTRAWTIELPDGEELELEIEFSCKGGSPAVTYGPPELCDPGEPPEIEIERISGPDGAELSLLPAEEAKLLEALYDDPPEDDGGDYYEDY